MWDAPPSYGRQGQIPPHTIATLLGWAFLGERLEPLQLVSAALILAAVVILQQESGEALIDAQ